MKAISAKCLLLIGALSCMSCLWDYDTIDMEMKQFPGTLELISGQFLQHSPEFYYWRIWDREQKLQTADSLHWYDDIAVAYDKLGQSEDAIRIMTEVYQRDSLRYESLANLGTFYIHNGQYEKGLAFLEEAIKINPDAHFGRERYQILLVRYLLSISWDQQKKLPLQTDVFRLFYGDKPHYIADYIQYMPPSGKRSYFAETAQQEQVPGYYEFVLADFRKRAKGQTEKVAWVLPEEEMQKAIAGISGMLRFGNAESPVLLDALGSLLSRLNDEEESHRHLAIISFIRAGVLSGNPKIQAAYEEKILRLMKGMGAKANDPISLYQASLQRELDTASKLKTEVQQNEIAWILAGKNPETEFAKAYYRSPKVKQSDWAYALKHKSNKEWHRKIRQHRAVEIERIDWKPPKTEISIDPKVVSYLDQRV
ncbi:MAG: tetratricopeptide repeat protein, partial [Bacteroidota bacterium]